MRASTLGELCANGCPGLDAAAAKGASWALIQWWCVPLSQISG